jgi:hypothetical protein
MKLWQSHRQVAAAKIESVEQDALTGGVLLKLEGGRAAGVTQDWVTRHTPHVGGYFVQYVDGYQSFCPAEAFERDHTAADENGAIPGASPGLPVAGYKPQDQGAIDRVNGFKADEERILRKLDAMKDDATIDQRWLATGRTDLEKAFMAINRSVFRPGRAKLPEDAGESASAETTNG